MSQRQFPRGQGRSKEDGPDGLLDRSPGKPSSKRVRAAVWLDQGVYPGGKVHFGALGAP